MKLIIINENIGKFLQKDKKITIKSKQEIDFSCITDNHYIAFIHENFMNLIQQKLTVTYCSIDSIKYFNKNKFIFIFKNMNQFEVENMTYEQLYKVIQIKERKEKIKKLL